jgi:DnaJ homolog subfamily C member 28
MFDDWDYMVDKQIRKAMDEGKFDNLPGYGKPIEWDDNPFADADSRAAYTMLKKHGFTLPWIAERQDIEDDLDKARRNLLRTWRWCGEKIDMRPGEQYEWTRALDQFREDVKALNKRIGNYNLKVPSDGFQRLPVNADREIEIIMGRGGDG